MFTTRKKYPLGDFNLVQLLTVDEPVEDGYRTIRYSVALSGAGRSLELLSADTEGEGKAIQKELAEFLELPFLEGGIDGWPHKNLFVQGG
jgi:hypothetical protein